VETYLLAVKAANKSPSWELPEATELFKLMHNIYAEAQRLLGILVLESCRGSIKIICGRNKKSGFESDNSDDSTP